MAIMIPKGCVTINEACRKMGLTRRTVYRYMKGKVLSYSKPGKHTFLMESEINKFLGIENDHLHPMS
jgi:excisionase family DNA binding protein